MSFLLDTDIAPPICGTTLSWSDVSCFTTVA
jgi:hypothetical protein